MTKEGVDSNLLKGQPVLGYSKAKQDTLDTA